MSIPELGVIEGYFGRPWSWDERQCVMELLAGHGYSFFLYAPKDDSKFRNAWREPFEEEELAVLSDFAGACRTAGVRFGVGFTPFEIYLDFDPVARSALAAKLAAFDQVGVEHLALLFDDMQGAIPDLAERQAEVADFAAAQTSASRIIVCPTYYSDDPVLDRAFGARPLNYLADLGRLLDPAIHVFWTGEEVCSREYSRGHLNKVADQLRRKPMLWDNYPVNDGPRMSQHLHLRAFTGRPAGIAKAISAHAVNPALQPILSCIPMLTLPLSYRQGSSYSYGAAFMQAAQAVVGPEVAAALQRDLLSLEDSGLDKLGERRLKLRDRYAAMDHPAAREVVAWLDGEYGASDELIQTQ